MAILATVLGDVLIPISVRFQANKVMRVSPRDTPAAVRELARDTVATCWSTAGLPTQILEGLFDGVWGAASWRDATAWARLVISRADAPMQAYRVARDRKFETFARLVAPYVSGAVLDVGAGGPDLLERLTADTRVATDILGTDRAVPGVDLVTQTQSDALPFADATFDTVLMTGMAHHLTAGDRKRLLRDTTRRLRPGGRLILIEETFSEESGCGITTETELQGAAAARAFPSAGYPSLRGHRGRSLGVTCGSLGSRRDGR